jgi:hypothetical protein
MSLRLRVDVGASPEPALLRTAIAARLAGRSFPPGPEDAVARAVARTVNEQSTPTKTDAEPRPWR